MSQRAGFDDGDRHGWNAVFCDRLERMMHGRAAADLAAAPGALVTLPMFLWVPGVAAGRKVNATGPTGGGLRLPVRMTWSCGHAVIVGRDAPVTVRWKAAGLGISASGTTSITAGAGAPAKRRTTVGPAVVCDDLGAPADIIGVWRTKTANGQFLGALVSDGHAASWEARMSIEGYVDRACRLAADFIAREIAEFRGAPTATSVVSDITLENIVTRMLVGTSSDGATGERTGSVTNLLAKSLEPATFWRVDPQRFVRVWLQRDAESEVRRAIGDPWIAPKVRKVATATAAASSRRKYPFRPKTQLKKTKELYNKKYPADRLGDRRLETALTPASDPNVDAVDLEQFAEETAENRLAV
ncbi:MAG TPA: hypothetical protein PKY13_08815 [Microthrixaceae bacterium]|nr:hypothetical protein [Microthrixaceae bacterium]HQF93276.1 hypothetical protein [Microthrixaceae bacterium]